MKEFYTELFILLPFDSIKQERTQYRNQQFNTITPHADLVKSAEYLLISPSLYDTFVTNKLAEVILPYSSKNSRWVRISSSNGSNPMPWVAFASLGIW
jgi:hypothetical protein